MKNKKLIWQLPFLVLLIIGTIFIIRQQQSVPYQQNNGLVFGTTYSLKYQCDSDLAKGVKDELLKVDNSLSPFNEKSIITAVNINKDVELNDMFVSVFNKAMEVSEIGYKKVVLKDNKVVKQDPRIMLDCSAIAKGFGTDVVANFLRSKGVKNFMIEIGGEIVTSGINEQRLPWKIGVTKPSDDPLGDKKGELMTILNVTDKAMATSGNYRNFYYKGGKKYAHTIDPKSGYPVQHSLLSATVLADDCATADAYATSFMVMGFEKAKKFLEKHPELMVYFIYSDEKGNNAVWFSPSLKDKIVE